MAHKAAAGDGMRAAVMRNGDGHVAIAFFDPAYVRSDTIVLDPQDNSLHAVLHESAHFIAHLDEETARTLHGQPEILLTARHYNGDIIDLVAPVAVSRKAH